MQIKVICAILYLKEGGTKMTFNIVSYGAKTDGSLCTKQIQKAIDDCFLNGGGEVVIPSGIYVTGGLRLRSGVTLHLLENAILKGSVHPEDYTDYLKDAIEPILPEEISKPVSTIKPNTEISRSVIPYSRWNNAIIRAIGAKNIAIIGEKGSEINGQNCFDELGEEDYRGPHAINMWFCENITLQGYTVRDSANWAHAIQNSKRIKVNDITVLGGHDGFDARTCDNIIIENSRFLTGDDCIAGFDNIGVTIRDCYFESSCSIFRFGATDMIVENCKGVAPATYGFRGSLSMEEKKKRADTTAACRHNCLNVFLYYCDNRAAIRQTPGNIVIRNCEFNNPDAVMRLPFGHRWCCNRSLSDITFENCVINGICKPIQLNAPKEEPVTLKLINCVVTPRCGYEPFPFIEGENIREVDLTKTTCSGFLDTPTL